MFQPLPFVCFCIARCILRNISHYDKLELDARGLADKSRTMPGQPRHSRRAKATFLDEHAQSFNGGYLGCSIGAKERVDVHWQTESDGINHAPIP